MDIKDYIKKESPYDLDCYSIENGKEIPAFTKKNVEFIEAVIKLDSNYSKEAKNVPPDDGSDFFENPSNPNKKYSGSAKYWFIQMKNCKADDFKKCLLGAIVAIDKSNSTHLEAANDGTDGGRKIIADRIYEQCNSANAIVGNLNKPFNKDPNNHLIAIITKAIQSKNKDSDRYNLSFATKFCAYAARELGAKTHYSKYDNVVANALPTYSNLFLDAKDKKNQYKITQSKLKNCENPLGLRLDLYERYTNTINGIIEVNKPINPDLTREQLDHIIWYAFKG